MARRNNYADSRRYYDWLDRANEDILCAKILLEDDRCYNAAAFHCQQTIEKALKAYILLKSDILADGHNLPWLCKRASKYDNKFSGWLAQSTSLSKCYIETRYPSDLPLELDYKQVQGYYTIAKEMYFFITEEVGQALEDKSAHPAQREKPRKLPR